MWLWMCRSEGHGDLRVQYERNKISLTWEGKKEFSEEMDTDTNIQLRCLPTKKREIKYDLSDIF